MTVDPGWFNSTFPGNETVPPPNTTLWGPIPTDAGRSLQADIIACAVTTFVIATFFVVLRFYTRGCLNNVLGAADWLILPALLCSAGVTASSIQQMVHGAGKHAWEIDWPEFPAMERAAWYGILFYNLSLSFTRISILLLYKRIFTYSWIKRAIQIVLVLVIAIGIWLVVTVSTACVPLEAFWNWSLHFTTNVYCQPPNVWWANAALHIASDLVIMALPMPVLSSLKLPRRQKYALVGVFALGFFVCIISVVRLVALIDVTSKLAFDATYTSAGMIYWTSVEVNSAICCACIMTLKPLIQRIFPRLLSPSKGVREPTLNWITPIDNEATRNSRHSLDPQPGSPHTHGSGPSNASDHAAGKRGSSSGGSGLPQVYEYEGDDGAEKFYYDALSGRVNLDLDTDTDLEAQRAHSSSTTAAPTSTELDYDDYHHPRFHPRDSNGSPDRGALRAPPKAHLRLGINVTRSVHVDEHARSPTSGGDRESPRRRSGVDVGVEAEAGVDENGRGSIDGGGREPEWSGSGAGRNRA